ncbi:hypothetical protein Tcan_01505, partial [Toxocara canis]
PKSCTLLTYIAACRCSLIKQVVRMRRVLKRPLTRNLGADCPFSYIFRSSMCNEEGNISVLRSQDDQRRRHPSASMTNANNSFSTSTAAPFIFTHGILLHMHNSTALLFFPSINILYCTAAHTSANGDQRWFHISF